MNVNKEEIWELFLFSEDEIKGFRYMRKYNSLIKTKKVEIIDNKEKIIKFALVGLFPIYRTFNHWGETMSSKKSTELRIEVHKKRLGLIDKVIGEELKGTDHYLQLLGIPTIQLLNPFYPLHRKLYNAVIYNNS